MASQEVDNLLRLIAATKQKRIDEDCEKLRNYFPDLAEEVFDMLNQILRSVNVEEMTFNDTDSFEPYELLEAKFMRMLIEQNKLPAQDQVGPSKDDLFSLITRLRKNAIVVIASNPKVRFGIPKDKIKH